MQGSKKDIVNAPNDKLFWVHEGPALKNLVDLRDLLRSLRDETFKFHVNELKNDFSNWISDVLKEADLAKKLKGIKSKRYTYKTVNDYLNSHFGM
ncbi:hypothetical protein A2961_02590 [Candidatus Woesebacteria bacterium RIFCSPLOWO2_01_FULL_39_21]|uniref:Uncharacterized protein n=1 Tax=Candidatus Woesebacteria bacterium RIFCSPLOWO2_01_FULL_39_21 TaxID=1802519 RepID=A0A1F8BIV4_9BACT|nr:MAG: hypothetical protein A2691_02775 [Candidatus Woesebacteria bacterium RIFCSPHIGHO2_01_FULL_39_23]OGM63994.1 MAG: hypothetical protein A2961_02590 [Candidatus Woesebacteria bacterium RIFCSPLOWO2_01_FULL_39_21]